MKKIKNIKLIPFLMMLLMVSLSSCEKFLEEIPPARYQISTLSKPLLDAFVIGAYEPLSRSRGRLWESTLTRDIEGLAEYCQLPAGGGTNYMNYNFEPQRKLAQMAEVQLGTVGSGNHYVDLFEDIDGVLWIVFFPGNLIGCLLFVYNYVLLM
jgi:hypothetical protein